MQQQRRFTLTDTNVDLASADFVGNLGDGGEAGGALAVDGVDGGFDRDASVEGGHTCLSCTSARGEDVADSDVFNQLWVEVDLFVDAAEDMGED